MSNTWFSDFIRNASEDERRKVYMQAMNLAAIEQIKKMRAAMADRMKRKNND